MPRPSPLLRFFRGYDGPRISKWVHYFEIYHRHFARFRDEPARILEVGVNQGGSLRMWQHYFHDDSLIVGVDLDQRCRQFEGGNVRIEIGDQEDRDFLRGLSERHGPFDVVIEDGGHHFGQQIATFEEVYPRMAEDGCYLVEDLHNSYWPGYGAGCARPARSSSTPRTSATSCTPGTPASPASRSTTSPARPARCTSTTASSSSSAARSSRRARAARATSCSTSVTARGARMPEPGAGQGSRV